MKELLDVSTAARRLGIAKITLYKLVSAKQIDFIKIGRRVLFSTDLLDKWIERRTKKCLPH